MRKSVYLSILLVASLLSLPSLAGSSFKMVVKVKGKVDSKIASADEWKPVFSSRLLKNDQDRVRTKADSMGRLKSSDGTVVTIAPKTELAIVDWRPEKGITKLKIVNRQGGIRAKVGKYFKGQRDFKIETPQAVLSARGTEYIVTYDPPTDSLAGTTIVDVLEGKVEGADGSGSVKIKAGQRYISDGTTSKVEPSPPDYLGVHPWLITPDSASVMVKKPEKSTGFEGEDPGYDNRGGPDHGTVSPTMDTGGGGHHH